MFVFIFDLVVPRLYKRIALLVSFRDLDFLFVVLMAYLDLLAKASRIWHIIWSCPINGVFRLVLMDQIRFDQSFGEPFNVLPSPV